MVTGLKIGVYEVFTQANPGQVDGRQGFVGDCGQITVQPHQSSIQYNTKQYNPSIASIQVNLYIVSPTSGIKATQCPKKKQHKLDRGSIVKVAAKFSTTLSVVGLKTTRFTMTEYS